MFLIAYHTGSYHRHSTGTLDRQHYWPRQYRSEDRTALPPVTHHLRCQNQFAHQNGPVALESRTFRHIRFQRHLSGYLVCHRVWRHGPNACPACRSSAASLSPCPMTGKVAAAAGSSTGQSHPAASGFQVEGDHCPNANARSPARCVSLMPRRSAISASLTPILLTSPATSRRMAPCNSLSTRSTEGSFMSSLNHKLKKLQSCRKRQTPPNLVRLPASPA